MRRLVQTACGVGLCALLALSSEAVKSNLSFEAARPILEALREIVPPSLAQAKDPPRAWEEWLRSEDARIRARLERGEEDSLVNFLLFGVSFTRRPRVLPEELAGEPGEVVSGRVSDLLQALAAPTSNEHVLRVRRLLERKGHRAETLEGRQAAARYLFEQLARVRKEQQGYRGELAAALRLSNATDQFAARSTLYRDRGLSLDTSLAPSYAIEQALGEIKQRGLIRSGQVRRAAVIGPGLEFTDKQGGYDYYPPQTSQPFALMDSLLRLGLADPNRLLVFTWDISPFVNEHLMRARRQAAARRGYRIELPLDADVAWQPGFRRYWERFGERIAVSATPRQPPPNVPRVHIKAVRVRPEFVLRLKPADVNVVVEHVALPETERLDLIVATNVFVYYDVFRQTLALANLERMLRPGGILLSNNALLELPSSLVRSAGYTTVVYSDRADDGDHIVWYVRR